jgi:hypothetical protein
MSTNLPPPSSDRGPGLTTSVESWFNNRFSRLLPIIDKLMSPHSRFGEPYRSHLQVEMAFFVSRELGHPLQTKTGSGSITVVDGIEVSTASIKKFVTKFSLQPTTFDNKHSRLNGFRSTYRELLGDDDDAFASSNRQVEKFVTACQELFATTSDEIETVSLARGSIEEWEKSVRSKSWKWWDNLHNAAKAELALQSAAVE